MERTLAQPTASNSSEEGFDRVRLWHVVLKRKWLICGVLAAVLILVFVWTARQPRVYQAMATVVIDPQAPKVLGTQTEVMELGSGSYWMGQDYYNTQFRILRSRTLAETV